MFFKSAEKKKTDINFLKMRYINISVVQRFGKEKIWLKITADDDLYRFFGRRKEKGNETKGIGGEGGKAGKGDSKGRQEAKGKGEKMIEKGRTKGRGMEMGREEKA